MISAAFEQYVVPIVVTGLCGIIVAWFANRGNVRSSLIKAETDLQTTVIAGNNSAYAAFAEYLKNEKTAADRKHEECERRYEELNQRFQDVEGKLRILHPALFIEGKANVIS